MGCKSKKMNAGDKESHLVSFIPSHLSTLKQEEEDDDDDDEEKEQENLKSKQKKKQKAPPYHLTATFNELLHSCGDPAGRTVNTPLSLLRLQKGS